MEIHQLRAFFAVARTGSFSLAARELLRTQPTVSASIQLLEGELGVRLFERGPKRVLLTGPGRVLAEASEALVSEWDKLVERVRERLTEGVAGQLRVGGGDVAVFYIFPEALRVFRRRHPEVTIIVRHQTAEETVHQIATGDVDLAIRTRSAVPRTLAFRTLLRTERIIICSKDNPIAKRRRRLRWSDLERQNIILPWQHSRSRGRIERALRRHKVAYHEAVAAGRWEMVKRYAALGIGIGIVPSVSLESGDERRLVKHAAAHLFGHAEYGLVLRKGQVLTPAVDEFIRILETLTPRGLDASS